MSDTSSKTTPTVRPSSSNDSPVCPSTGTSPPSNTPVQLSIYSPEDSRANRIPLHPSTVAAQKMTVNSGLRCIELSRTLGRDGLFLRTCLESSIWNSTRCFLTWKLQATPAGRLIYQLAESMPPTAGTGSSLLHTPTAKCNQMSPSMRSRSLWPTPRSSEWKGTGPRGSKSHRHRLARRYLDATLQEVQQQDGHPNPNWIEWLMGISPIGWTE